MPSDIKDGEIMYHTVSREVIDHDNEIDEVTLSLNIILDRQQGRDRTGNARSFFGFQI